MNRKYDKKLFIREMYAAIADRFDLTNRLISLGHDRRWRRLAVKDMPRSGWLVDLGGGTGDLTLAYLSKCQPDAQIAIVDFSRPMLQKARSKLSCESWMGRVHFIVGDIERLPLKSSCFAGGMSGFVLRNLPSIDKVAMETFRVLQPGGRAVFLDATRPRVAWLRRLFDLYFQKIMLRLAGVVNPGHQEAYHYLARSVIELPPPGKIVQEFSNAGFAERRFRPLWGGIITIFVNSK